MLAGGTEAAIIPLILAGFCAMRGLVAEEVDPTLAMRPFDATRAGFVMGEGACILVLEEFEAARARGATIYAEVLGYGASNDAHHLAQPEPEATGVAAMISTALASAGIAPERVGYVNAHGTSTPLGDLAETRALRQVFGEHAYELAVSSTKSVMGHCFGAAGAIEAMMCAMALLPPDVCRRRSTTGIPTRSSTSTTSRTRPARSTSTSRCRTRWGSAGTTGACCSGGCRRSFFCWATFRRLYSRVFQFAANRVSFVGDPEVVFQGIGGKVRSGEYFANSGRRLPSGASLRCALWRANRMTRIGEL